MAELLSPQYNPRSVLQQILEDPDRALKSEGLWLCAWCYKCYKRCPQGLKLPEILHTAKQEVAKRGLDASFEKAVSIIEKHIPFPILCWYTCFHPERTGIPNDKIVAMKEKLAGRPKKGKKPTNRQGRAAIIGSGPAGLTAACQLAERGYPVTLFEALPKIGGMLRKSMPAYRLPRKELDNEIQLLKDLGVEIRTSTEVGKDIKFDELWRCGYKVVFVAVGAHTSLKLGIEGEDLDGVIDALNFLWTAKESAKVDITERVGVIGGGNVAIDAARTALRHKAKEVVILYRRSLNEMTANPWEIGEAEKEGVRIEFQVAPKKILKKDGKVAGLECFRVELGELDETGRKRPVPIEGSEFSLQLGTVIVAIGERTETSFLPNEVERDRSNRILVNPVTMETSMTRVFAGGDAVTGPASVIEAILAGKRAAGFMEKYLNETGEREDAHLAS